MSLLDMRTLVILTMVANFVFAAIILAVRHMAPGEASVRRWAQGAIACGAGGVLVVLRGVIPDLLSVIAANVLFAWGYASLYLGSRHFFRMPTGPRIDWLLGALVGITFIPLTYVMPSLEIRVIVISLALAVSSLLHARLLLGSTDKSLLGPARFIGWVLLAAGIVMLVRGAMAPFADLSENFLETEHWIKSSAFLTSLIVSMCLGAGLPIMLIGRMQHTLAEEEMRAHAMLQAMPDMMFRLNADGTLLDYKADRGSFSALTGEPSLNENFFRVLPVDLVSLLQHCIRQALDHSALEHLEYRSHDDRFFELRIAPSGSNEVTIIVRDISGRKESEAELEAHRNHLEALVVQRTEQLNRAKEAAEAANIAKNAFLGNISHEMRTPMHQIGGLINLIKREALSPKQQEHLTKLNLTAQRMNRLIETILAVTQIEANKFDLREEKLSVDELLDEVISGLEEAAKNKGLVLTRESSLRHREFLGDPLHLRLALLNYTENALRFTESGQIAVSVSLLDETADQARIKFAVEDTGIGIPPEVLPRLFQLFQQADNSATRKFGGAGTGLYITKRIAQFMGGEAGCESQPGSGSQFWFTVCLKKSGGSEPAAATVA